MKKHLGHAVIGGLLLFSCRGLLAQNAPDAGPRAPYQGWVELIYETPQGDDEHHRWNTQTGMIGSAVTTNHIVTYAEVKDPTTGLQIQYEAKHIGGRGAQVNLTGRITITGLHPPEAQLAIIAAKSPLTFPELLMMARQRYGENGIVMTQDADQGMTRYRLERAADSVEKRPSPEETMARRVALQVPSLVWVNPATQRVQQMASTKAGDPPSRLRYNVPAVTSIYDLGVPRDAEIFDCRPDEATRAAYNRVTAHVQKRLPDGVAVKLERTQVPGRDPRVELIVEEVAAERSVIRTYKVGDKEDAATLALPANWTEGDGIALFAQLARTRPANQTRLETMEAWKADIDPATGEEFHTITQGAGAARRQQREPGAEPISLLYQYQLRMGPARDFYPFGIQNGIYAPGWVMDLKTSPDQPGLTAFHLLNNTDGPDTAVEEDEFWIDPAHDDRPVRHVEVMFRDIKTRRQVGTRTVTEFAAYATMPAPDGRSYPTTWTQTQTQHAADGTPTEKRRVTTTFHYFPGKKSPPIPTK